MAKVIDEGDEERQRRYGVWPGRIKKHGFVMVPNILISYQRRLGLSSQQLNTVLVLLSYWWDRDRLPFPSKALIANRMGVSERTVQRNLQELENAGYITRISRRFRGRGQSSNSYSLQGLIDRLLALEDEYAASAEKVERFKELQAIANETPKPLRKG